MSVAPRERRDVHSTESFLPSHLACGRSPVTATADKQTLLSLLQFVLPATVRDDPALSGYARHLWRIARRKSVLEFAVQFPIEFLVRPDVRLRLVRMLAHFS